jgi:hypothetical protein
MSSPISRHQGFITILILMIIVMVSIFFAAKQYQKLAERNHKPVDRQSMVDQAVEAATGLEKRDRENFRYMQN